MAVNFAMIAYMSRLMTKPTKWLRPVKTQISLGIRPVWSESLLPAWGKLGSLATHWAHSEDSDQTGRMPRLIWVFAGRTVILLVLSWGGSYFFGLFLVLYVNIYSFHVIIFRRIFFFGQSGKNLHMKLNRFTVFWLEYTVKKLKIWTPEKFAVIIQKVEQFGFMTVMHQKDADGMANSVDPDQTAPRSSLSWVYTVCLDQPVGKLRIIRVLPYST